jgi:Rrf2 family protein
MVTMKTKYGLKALGKLAQEYGKGPLLASRISEHERIPPDFLRFILLQLKNGGLLQSKNRKGGGYDLMRKPSTISVGLLVRILEGPLHFLPCTISAGEGCGDCPYDAACSIRTLFLEASNATTHILDQTILADLAASRDFRRQINDIEK